MKTMLICSRGCSSTTRNIVKDLNRLLITHKENKYDQKNNFFDLKELMDINDCESTIYFESTKRAASVWIANEKGPSIKFSVYNLFTIKDLSIVTNCQKNAGHKLIFDLNFDTDENLKMVKTLFSKTFIESEVFDRVLAFYYYDNKIWMRVYAIANGVEEIGPRIVMEIDKILGGFFNGELVYKKKEEEVDNL